MSGVGERGGACLVEGPLGNLKQSMVQLARPRKVCGGVWEGGEREAGERGRRRGAEFMCGGGAGRGAECMCVEGGGGRGAECVNTVVGAPSHDGRRKY